MSSESKLNQGDIEPDSNPKLKEGKIKPDKYKPEKSKMDQSEPESSTPIITRAGAKLGRNIFSRLVNSVSPFGAAESPPQKLNDSTGMESDDSSDNDGTSVDLKRTISVQTELKFDRRRVKNGQSQENSLELNDTDIIQMPPVVYDKSDDEWPIREALMFRFGYNLDSILNIGKLIFCTLI